MIVVVVGMHRSGTSSVAGLLHASGVPMGEESVLIPRPSPENPKGFYENVRFRLLNDRIARRAGYRVDSWQPQIPACRPGRFDALRMRRLLRRYDARYPRWGFKDPRTCLTLDAWLRGLEGIAAADRVRVVHAVRDPRAVAASLTRRNGLRPETGLALWRAYNERVLRALDAWGVPRLTVRYEDLCRRPVPTAAALCRFAGVPVVDGVAARWVDPALDHGGEPAADTAELPSAVRELDARIAARVRESQRAHAPTGGPA